MSLLSFRSSDPSLQKKKTSPWRCFAKQIKIWHLLPWMFLAPISFAFSFESPEEPLHSESDWMIGKTFEELSFEIDSQGALFTIPIPERFTLQHLECHFGASQWTFIPKEENGENWSELITIVSLSYPCSDFRKLVEAYTQTTPLRHGQSEAWVDKKGNFEFFLFLSIDHVARYPSIEPITEQIDISCLVCAQADQGRVVVKKTIRCHANTSEEEQIAIGNQLSDYMLHILSRSG